MGVLKWVAYWRSSCKIPRSCMRCACCWVCRRTLRCPPCGPLPHQSLQAWQLSLQQILHCPPLTAQHLLLLLRVVRMTEMPRRGSRAMPKASCRAAGRNCHLQQQHLNMGCTCSPQSWRWQIPLLALATPPLMASRETS